MQNPNPLAAVITKKVIFLGQTRRGVFYCLYQPAYTAGGPVRRGTCSTFLKTQTVWEIGQILLAAAGRSGVTGVRVGDAGETFISDGTPLSPIAASKEKVAALLTALWAGGREDGLLKQAAAAFFYFQKKRDTAFGSLLSSVCFTAGPYLRAEKANTGEPLYGRTDKFLEFVEMWVEAREMSVAIKSHERRLLRVRMGGTADAEVGARWCSWCDSKTSEPCAHKIAAHLWAIQNGWGGLQGFLTPKPVTAETVKPGRIYWQAGTSRLLRAVSVRPSGITARLDGGSQHEQFYSYDQLWVARFEDITESVATSAKVQMPRMVPV